MGKRHRHGVESTAAVLHHPIHPMLIVLPAASLMGVLATDLAFRATGDGFWALASWWLLAAGVVTGLLAAIPGAIDYFAIPEVRALPSSHIHATGNIVALGLAGYNLMLRSDEVTDIGSIELGLTIAVVLLLGVTAWLGGELSYRHRIGVIADESPEASDAVRQPAE